jgi:hypothetical protein
MDTSKEDNSITVMEKLRKDMAYLRMVLQKKELELEIVHLHFPKHLHELVVDRTFKYVLIAIDEDGDSVGSRFVNEDQLTGCDQELRKEYDDSVGVVTYEVSKLISGDYVFQVPPPRVHWAKDVKGGDVAEEAEEE